MADIDWPRFAEDVTTAMAADGRTLDAIARANKGLSVPVLSRARAGAIEPKPGNYLKLCQVFRLDPFAYLLDVLTPPRRRKLTLKRIVNQHLSRGVSREAREAS